MISAVIFDMDGLLFDSEPYWEQARRQFGRAHGCEWSDQDELAAKGKNSSEWAALIKDRCNPTLDLDDIIAGVTQRMRALYDRHLPAPYDRHLPAPYDRRMPVLPGAIQTVRRLAAQYPLGLASSSPPSLIDFALSEAGIRECFAAMVSSDEVGKGKPAPDVFLVTAQRLGVSPDEIVVFEDSSSGIQAAHAAGMAVIAVPNAHYPPSKEALSLASLTLPSLEAFSPEDLAGLRRPKTGHRPG